MCLLENTSESKDKFRCDMCDIDFTDQEDISYDGDLLEHLSMYHMKDIDQCNVEVCRAYIGDDAKSILLHFKVDIFIFFFKFID